MPPRKGAKKRTGSHSSASASAVEATASATNGAVKAAEEEKTVLLKNADSAKKKSDFLTRTLWTFIMIALFFTVLGAGHLWIIGLVVLVQVMVFKEVISIASVPSEEKKLPFFRTLNWYFFFVALYFFYGESVIYYFKHIVLVDAYILPLATHHRFISFVLYVMGFVFFVMNLQKGHYKFQFTQFCWTHMVLLLVVVQSHFITNNILEGLIWFFVPVAFVICNDTFAYVCGFLWGRTQLIAVSPKKTVEGFVGGWICTVIIGLGLANWLMRYKYMICPVRELGVSMFSGVDCVPNPVFLPHTFSLEPLSSLIPLIPSSITFAPVQFHFLMFATFASLIAPFGGFFASGLKRAFSIKDFGDSIPGHGGMTDRMDCQFMMGFFSYMYYQSFIAQHQVALGKVLESAITSLSAEEQVELVKGLHKYLIGQGRLGEGALECLAQHGL
ncbi:phosphatidate cytidylyltransferase [Saitoella coloradoensis]